MSECRSCNKPLTEKDEFCPYCGYDPKSDTINPSFHLNPQKGGKKIKVKTRSPSAVGLDPRVKNFAFIGVAIIIFSVFYKYNFSVPLITGKIKSVLKRGIGASDSPKGKDSAKKGEEEKLVWNDVKAFIPEKKAGQYKELVVEGIFFDPAGKSFVTINSEVVGAGEVVSGAQVVKINRENVELLVEGVSHTLGVEESMPLPENK